MNVATTTSNGSAVSESVYVVPGQVSADAITSSLQALLPTRHHEIARHRFTVLDTFDGRIRRAGACLTRDGVNGTSRIAWQGRGGGSHFAMLFSQPVSFAWDLPEGPLQQAVTSVIGVRRLFAQNDAEEYGSLLDVLDDREKTVARLRVASGQARLPTTRGVWQALPTIVTLTGLRGYEGVFERLVPVIESRPGIEPCPDGPLGVMLQRVGAPVRGDLSLPRVDLASSVRADIGARQIHAALLDLFMANEPGVRANLDTEFLHDFRVNVRRTRSLLGQIRDVFPPDVVGHFSTEFSWIGRLTGPPRDLDVLVLALRDRREELSPSDGAVLMSFLREAQQQEQDELVRALDSDRYGRLLSDWKAFLEGPIASEPGVRNAAEPLAAVVSQRAWRLSRRIARAADAIDDHTTAAHLHQIRIDAKKLRYLIDVTPAFYDASDFTCILSALKKLQRALGDFNDAHVQERRLLECGRALCAAGRPAEVLLALGRMAEQSRQRGERLRSQVIEKLARFRARDTRSACRRAFKRPEAKERVR
jgi:CHAD domain-containing protein